MIKNRLYLSVMDFAKSLISETIVLYETSRLFPCKCQGNQHKGSPKVCRCRYCVSFKLTECRFKEDNDSDNKNTKPTEDPQGALRARWHWLQKGLAHNLCLASNLYFKFLSASSMCVSIRKAWGTRSGGQQCVPNSPSTVVERGNKNSGTSVTRHIVRLQLHS